MRLNREIKFRAWDKKEKKWLENGFLQIDLDGSLWKWMMGWDKVSADEVRIMEYIGHKDIDGNEIYEGDILLEHFEYPDGVKFIMGDIRNVNRFGIDFEKTQIIGNIYENPGLLEVDAE